MEAIAIALGELVLKGINIAIDSSNKSDAEKAELRAEAAKVHAKYLEDVGGHPARMKEHEDAARAEVAKRFASTSTMGGTVEHLFDGSDKDPK